MLVLGIFSKKLTELNLSFLYEKEAVILGSKGGEEGYEEAVQLLGQKSLQITPMITHRFPLEGTVKGFELFDDKAQNALRIIIEPCG